MRFCGHCGTESISPRFTLKSFLQGTLQNVFDLHKGLFYTLLELTRRPGPLIYEYIKKGEHRQALYNPVKYFFLAFAVSVIQSRLYGAPGVLQWFEAYLNLPGWVSELESILMALLLLIFAICFTFSMRMVRAFSYNFAETLIYILYATGHFLFFYPTLSYPLGLFGQTVSGILIVFGYAVYAGFLCWFAVGFISKKKGKAIGEVLSSLLRVFLLFPMAAFVAAAAFALPFLLIYVLITEGRKHPAQVIISLSLGIILTVIFWLRDRAIRRVRNASSKRRVSRNKKATPR